MMDYKITAMALGHVSQVAQIEAACFSDPWPQNIIENELTNPLSYWLVAENGGCVLGYVGSQTVMDESDMMNIAVRSDFRGQGIARALVVALISALKEKGSQSLTLEVRASNAPAIALYESFGFELVGRRKNYYFHPQEDALIYKKVFSE